MCYNICSMSYASVLSIKELMAVYHCDLQDAKWVMGKVADEFGLFMSFRDDVNKSLELLRADKIIKSNMEAVVTVSLKDEYKVIADFEDSLKQLLIVADVRFVDDVEGLNEYATAYIKAEKATGGQCPRCWNYFDEATLDENGLCPRCSAVVKSLA